VRFVVDLPMAKARRRFMLHMWVIVRSSRAGMISGRIKDGSGAGQEAWRCARRDRGHTPSPASGQLAATPAQR